MLAEKKFWQIHFAHVHLHFLNQAHIGCRLVRTLFLEIALVHNVCVSRSVCVFALRPLITSDVIWWDIDRIKVNGRMHSDTFKRPAFSFTVIIVLA